MRKMQTGALELKRIFLCTAIVGALCFQTGSAWAAKDAFLTSVKGEASDSTGALDSHSELGDNEQLETGDESGCSILLDENAVVELCGQTRISFATDEKRGNRIVNIESGTVRMIVEPREAGERIEIHTPAAIATILGTIIYVTVDPVTQEATFTSSDSQVNIRERDDKDCTPIGLPAEAGIPQCAEGTTIGSLEQLTVVPGEKKHEKKQVSEQDLAMLGGCLFNFHDLAAEIDRMAQANKATQRVVAVTSRRRAATTSRRRSIRSTTPTRGIRSGRYSRWIRPSAAVTSPANTVDSRQQEWWENSRSPRLETRRTRTPSCALASGQSLRRVAQSQIGIALLEHA